MAGLNSIILDAINREAADSLAPLYKIEIQVTKSPKSGMKCGAIVVFKFNTLDDDFEKALDPKKYDKWVHETMKEQMEEASKHTETLHRDPEYFSEAEGRWLGWAIDRALVLYDLFGGTASIALKCPQLRVKRERTLKQVAQMRSTPEELFPEAREITALLDGGFNFDPWEGTIRRGRISAEMSKR